jgi:hypothetical protein
MVVVIAGAIVLGLLTMASRPSGQSSASTIHRAPDGHPDLTGVWQAVNSASWDLEDHTGRLGIPGGQTVVEGGDIPYQETALAQRAKNSKAATGDPYRTLTDDPISRCYMPGVPRATYMPFPFQIVQSAAHVTIAYEFARTSRQIYLQRPHTEGRLYNWMGDSIGHWEGETLVVDVVDFNDSTWLDAAGNFHSDELHVVERYTPIDKDHLSYEATLDDPKVFTRPWKISMPLYRRVEPRAQALEYMCLEYKEQLIYGEQ